MRSLEGLVNSMFNDIYKGKRIIITGHTGFKGTWLALWLMSLGANVLGYSLPPEMQPSIFEIVSLDRQVRSINGNILDTEKLEKAFKDFRPEFVFHLAAQPLVRRSYFEPVLTYQTNVIGTLNVLQAALKCQSVKAFVNVTTDKCYENKETMIPYKENDSIGGYDMYSSSKGCVEILSASYRRCFLQSEKSFNLATARAGNVIGGGDWAIDRLVPDCVRAISSGIKITLRNPDAIRPWQHVTEPLGGYLLLGQKLAENDGKKFAQSFNFGPDKNSIVTVGDMAQKLVRIWGKGQLSIRRDNRLHEAKLLLLDTTKAEKLLGWHVCFNADEAIEKTVSWYRRFYEMDNMLACTLQQIKDYERVFDGKNS